MCGPAIGPVGARTLLLRESRCWPNYHTAGGGGGTYSFTTHNKKSSSPSRLRRACADQHVASSWQAGAAGPRSSPSARFLPRNVPFGLFIRFKASNSSHNHNYQTLAGAGREQARAGGGCKQLPESEKPFPRLVSSNQRGSWHLIQNMSHDSRQRLEFVQRATAGGIRPSTWRRPPSTREPGRSRGAAARRNRFHGLGCEGCACCSGRSCCGARVGSHCGEQGQIGG